MQYCPTCGAANEAEYADCFACSQPLSAAPDNNTNINQPEESLLKGRYRLLTQIGSGGFGAVYRAQDHAEHNHIVAIKAINLHGLTPTQVIEATDGFNRELNLLSSLSHRHVPQIYDHFTDVEHWYLVMQFIDGSTLEDYLHLHHPHTSDVHTTRTLPLDEVLRMALQLCDVLSYLHTRQPAIIYRDLKPSNIMRTPRGQLYLIDFGIARSYKEGKNKDTIPLGSPGYAAPEQYGKAQTTPRADIYSLGALLHQLLSGIDPSAAPFIFRPLLAYGEEGLPELDALITRMVNLEPEQRPADIQAVAQSIQAIVELRQKQAPSAIKSTPMPSDQNQQNYSNAYYKPGYAQLMMQQQATQQASNAKQSRRRLLGSAIAAGVIFSGILGYGIFHKPVPDGLDPGSQSVTVPGASNQPNFKPTNVVTKNKQEMIISVDTTNAPGNTDVAYVSADDQGMLTFWTSDYRQKYTIELGAPVHSLDWGAHNAFLLAATDYDAYLLKIQDMTITKTTPAPSEHIVRSSRSRAPYINAALRTREDTFQLTDAAGLTSIFQANPQHTQWRLSRQSRQSRVPAMATRQGLTYNKTNNAIAAYDGNTAVVWDSDTGKVLGSVLMEGLAPTSALAWSADGGTVLIGTTDGFVLFWEYGLNGGFDVVGKVPSQKRISALAWDVNQHRYLAAANDTLVIAVPQDINHITYDNVPLSAPKPQQPIRSIAIASEPAAYTYAAVTGERFVQFWTR